ncbi:MAG: hypothetical protein RIS79_3559 [Verrucomicrobiota bacterium]|jgi:hypothetical protein
MFKSLIPRWHLSAGHCMIGRMIWRAAAALAVLFWAVMTGLLIRDVYFPDESRFAEVPTGMVFDRFLRQAEVNANTLHLYHGADKIGHANLTLGSSRIPESGVRYHWLLRGVVERLQARGERVDISWEVTGVSDGMGEWRQMEFTASLPRQQSSVKVVWAEGEKFPTVHVTREGKTVLDTQNAGLLIALGLAGLQGGAGGEWAQALVPIAGGSGAGEEFHFTAREGGIELAGRERRCFLVTAPLPGGQQVRLVFAETGELARIDLPQEYRLIEPLIHGMIPSLPTSPDAR